MRRFRLRLPVRCSWREQSLASSRRLSGLLSGYLPTDTRPQARAKLGNRRNNRFDAAVNAKISSGARKISAASVKKIATNRSRRARAARWRSALLVNGSTRWALRMKRDHDGDAAEEEDALQDVRAVAPRSKQVGERPAGGEGGAEHLGANQDRRADHGQHVVPVDAAVAGEGWVCRSCIWVLLAGALSAGIRRLDQAELALRDKVSPAGTAQTARRSCA